MKNLKFLKFLVGGSGSQGFRKYLNGKCSKIYMQNYRLGDFGPFWSSTPSESMYGDHIHGLLGHLH